MKRNTSLLYTFVDEIRLFIGITVEQVLPFHVISGSVDNGAHGHLASCVDLVGKGHHFTLGGGGDMHVVWRNFKYLSIWTKSIMSKCYSLLFVSFVLFQDDST